MANMFIYTNKFNRISSRKGSIRNFIISTSVCDCAECACWLSLVMRHCSLYSDMLRYSSLKWVLFSSFPEPLANKTYLDWLTCPNGDVLMQLQQHNRELAVAQTVLRHSLGISLGECTSSWQESFTVDKF